MMFTPAQIHAGSADRATAFDSRIAAYLRSTYPLTSIAEDRFCSDIAAICRYAEYLGFVLDAHLVDIVEACFVHGNSIFDEPNFRRIVARDVWSAEDKCRAIRRQFILPRSGP